MSLEKASKYFGFDIIKLFDYEEKDLGNMGVTLREDDLSDLFKELYDWNSKEIRLNGFPHDLVLETNKKFYVETLLTNIRSHLTTTSTINRNASNARF